MAQQGLQSEQEKDCSVCSDLLKDPVTIPCGHSHCRSCVKSLCDEENQETNSCSQCDQVFTPKPEDLKRTGRPAASGPAGVAHNVLDKQQESLNEDQSKMLPAETEANPEEEPESRAEFIKYSCEITLDPNTVNESLLLSEDNRKVTRMDEYQVYPSHPDRFMDGCQVMSEESLTGRHYWEVERSGGAISVAVSYKDISKTGTESIFGFNYKSWALDCFEHRYIVRHNCIIGAGPHPVSSRVGVYLDHGAGILSFYNISETMTLLHRVQTTFTEPLYAGLWVHGQKSAAVVLKPQV